MSISRRFFLLASSAVAATLLAGCNDNDDDNTSSSTGDSTTTGTDFSLRIAETTDVHGHIFPYDFATGDDGKTNSLAHIYDFVEQERTRTAASNGKEYFMLVDNGDNLQGEAILNIYNDGLKKGTVENHIIPEVFNFMGYEIGVVGNHDVEFGKTVYDHLATQFNFPYLAANAVVQGTQSTTDKVKPGDGSRQPYFANAQSNGAYVIRTFAVEGKPDVKVAILGLSTPESKVFLSDGDENAYIYFEDMVESAAYWMEKIQAEQPDLIVGMCHAGYEYDLTPGQDENTYRNYNPVQLIAEQVPGFDILFWGHDHLIKEEAQHNNVLLLGGNHYAQELSIADITFTYNETTQRYDKTVNGAYLQVLDDESNGKIAGTMVDETTTQLVAQSTTKLEPSAAFMSAFGSLLESAKNQFQNTVIGTLTTMLNTKDAVFGDSAFNDLVHHLEKYAAKKEFAVDVDMSIAAPLKYSFPNDVYDLTGTLVYADMWNLYFYDNLHAVIEMSGQEIKDYLEFTFGLWFNQMQNEDDNLLALKSAEDAAHPEYMKTEMIYWNMDTFAGIVYTVDVSQATGSRVTILGLDSDYDGEIDGNFDLSQTYKVSVNSYRYGGGGGHFAGIGIEATAMKARTLYYSATGLRDYLISYIQEENNGVIAPEAIGNWKVIPETWAEKGRAKDDPLIFWSGATGR